MAPIKPIPQEKGVDHTLSLLTEGYLFIPNRSRKFGSDVFQTRLLGQKVICMAGEEAAALFYDESKFRRKGAVPKRIQKSLFGEKAIQTLDDGEHKHRKALFMSLMSPAHLQSLNIYVTEEWQAAALEWEQQESVEFFKEAEHLMMRVACRFAGVPLKQEEVESRARDMGAMIDAFGGMGPRYWQGRTARDHSEEWIEKMVKGVRRGLLPAIPGTALFEMSWYKQPDGKKLPSRLAAVEILNIIRPIVAIGRYITFGAVAMHEHPETRSALSDGSPDFSTWFAQEVRRYYPFAPFTGARVRKDFIWKDYEFKKGTLVLLDLYGTNHHPDLWGEPEVFKPERFKGWSGSPFSFIPQGGGEYEMGHRCAGEWVTVEAMKTSFDFIARKLDYDVPPQNLQHSLVRMPSIPKSRFILQNIRLIG